MSASPQRDQQTPFSTSIGFLQRPSSLNFAMSESQSSTHSNSSFCQVLLGHPPTNMPPRQPPACQQCRIKQKRCDRQRPCERCRNTPHLCLFPGDSGYTCVLNKSNKLKLYRDQDLHAADSHDQGEFQARQQSEPRSEIHDDARPPKQDVSVLSRSVDVA